jgi:hypothetical protein
MDLAGETALIIRHLIVPLTVGVVTVCAGQACAQGERPAPRPSQAVQPNDPASPPMVGPGDECRSGFASLRQEAEKRGGLIRAASERHAPPAEACQLIGNFGQAEIKMLNYVESHAATCGIPPQVSDQMRTGHRNTETMLKKVCAAAQQAQRGGPSGPTGDFWTLPEKQI